jgi:endonuclease/exonuclease/phosphatase family metal-dependent hydrolase
MSLKIRAGTFNMENLFSRAKALNLADKNETARILNQVGTLEQLLGKAAYSADDKKSILSISQALSAYIEIREDRGKLFSGTGAKRKVVAAGAGDWDGAIDYLRANVSEQARASTAGVVNALAVDVLCTVEVENRPMLALFNSQALGAKKFTFPMLIDAYDPRGIDVGLLTRFEITKLRTHMFDRDASGPIFSRDCLQVEMRLPDGRPLNLLCNHLKSQGYGSPAANDSKRKRQAQQIARILQDYDLVTDLVIVAGDMNDDPSSPALAPLLGVANLSDVLQLKFGNQTDQRWTYEYRGKTSQIDFLLVSKPLADGFKDAGVERRGMLCTDPATRFKSVTTVANAASDHGAVWAEFEV